MLNSRMSKILQELMAEKEIITSSYLASVIQVTSRTIRNDIKELNHLLVKNGAEIKSVRGTGYELIVTDDLHFKNFLAAESKRLMPGDGIIPSYPEDRVRFLIKRLLLAEEYIKLEELADEIFISKSTIQNDLRDVKEILSAYGISLDKRPNYGIKLKGDEVKFRFCMSEHICPRSDSDIELINSHLSILPKQDLETIRTIILEKIRKRNITLSDIGLNNLIIHIAIACSRIRNGKYVNFYPNELKEIKSQVEYSVATKIVQVISTRLQVTFPDPEIAYVAVHLLGTRLIAHLNINDKEIEALLDKEIYDLSIHILESIEQELKLGIKKDRELLVSLCLHLKPAINRFRYGMNLRNPMIEAIKANYPAAFQAGIIAGIVIKDELGLDIHEHEIAYIAIHIGAAIERAKSIQAVKRCIIVCASGAGSARLLYYKLLSKFGSRLEIIGTTEYYKLKDISFDSIDFIVSTIPIPDTLSVPILQVNTILGGNDFVKIEDMLGVVNENRIEYLKQELVFLQQCFETKMEVLSFLVEKLIVQGLVNEGFLQAVLEREKVSPTCFGNLVAIPHPIMPQTVETFWTICTLKKPIDWDGKRVQFVCLLSVRKNSNEDLLNMYKMLGKVVDDSQVVQQLLKCSRFSEFQKVFYKNK